MKTINILIAFLLGSQLYAQTIEEQLSMPIITCETIATNAQHLVSTLDITETDSIVEIIDIWRTKCSDSEPAARLEMLHSISTQTFSKEKCEYYLTQYLSKYLSRTEYYYSRNYESNKTWLDYVPNGEAFDQWCQQKAYTLLEEQDTEGDQYLMCLLFANEHEEFYSLLSKKSTEDSVVKSVFDKKRANSGYIYYHYSAYLGAWTPLGHKSDIVGLSPHVGFDISVQFNQKYYTGFKMRYTRWLDRRDIKFYLNGETISTDEYYNFLFGVFISQTIINKSSYDIRLHSGLNANVIGISDDRLRADNDDAKDATMIDFEFGTNINRMISARYGIGLYATIHYAPFHWNNHVKTEIGEWNMTAGLSFRF